MKEHVEREEENKHVRNIEARTAKRNSSKITAEQEANETKEQSNLTGVDLIKNP